MNSKELLTSLNDLFNGPDRHILDQFAHYGLSASSGLRYTDLRGVDFSSRNLRFMDFSYSNLEGAIFRDADIYGAVFDGANVDTSLLKVADNFELCFFDNVECLSFELKNTINVPDTETMLTEAKSCSVIFFFNIGIFVVFAPNRCLTFIKIPYAGMMISNLFEIVQAYLEQDIEKFGINLSHSHYQTGVVHLLPGDVFEFFRYVFEENLVTEQTTSDAEAFDIIVRNLGAFYDLALPGTK